MRDKFRVDPNSPAVYHVGNAIARIPGWLVHWKVGRTLYCQHEDKHYEIRVDERA